MNNDYNQNYVNTGERPQNVISDHLPEERFQEYPQLKELVKLKDDLLKKRNHPPVLLKQDPRELKWDEMGQFDVILMDPPWMEYKIRIQEARNQLQGANHSLSSIDDERLEGWSKEDIATLQIDKVSKTPSFIFLWAGSNHLDDARYLLKRWGFKRCEDVVWLKTNKEYPAHKPANDKSYLQRVKEHCLVGVKGDVKRASDSHIIHANIDTDVIVSEEPPIDILDKPTEIYDIIERFCLGRRRLQLFINDKHKPPRPGWCVVSKDVIASSYNPTQYNEWLSGDISELGSYIGGEVIGTTPEIEDRRPKSPKKSTSNSMGMQSAMKHFHN
jgi:mRNA m6A methyltransferase non-catalytic subunit